MRTRHRFVCVMLDSLINERQKARVGDKRSEIVNNLKRKLRR